MKRKIKFQKCFKEALLSGKKIITSRTRKMGKEGDWFRIFGKDFIIFAVHKWKLENVVKFKLKEEGFSDPNDFVKLWIRLHPRIGYNPEQEVWVHWFRMKEVFDRVIARLHFKKSFNRGNVLKTI